MSREIEEQTIRAFVQKSKQDRCCLLLGHPKRRKDFTKELAHFKWLDERFAHPIPSSVAHTPEEVASLLRKRGAGSKVWAISEDPAIDGTELILEEAIKRVLGREMARYCPAYPASSPSFKEKRCRVSDCWSFGNDNWPCRVFQWERAAATSQDHRLNTLPELRSDALPYLGCLY